MGDEQSVEFTVIGFNPKRSFNNAQAGVRDIQLVWVWKCSDLIQAASTYIGKASCVVA
jgi:hypothetical protein